MELEENLNPQVDLTAPESREDSVVGGLSRGSQPSLAFMVVGMARSGTTLIQRLLSEIPGVWVPPETHFWRHAAALVDKFSPPFDAKAATDSMRWFADLQSSSSLDMSPEAVASLVDGEIYLWGLFEALVRSLSPPDALVLGEKTPDHARWSIQLMSSVPSLKVIGVIRDPREVFRSHQTVPWGLKEPWRFAEKWIEHARILEDLAVLFPDRVQIVRLEDLVQQPREIRDASAALIGVADREVSDPADHSTVDRMFGEHESWKARALLPIAPTKQLWSEALAPEAIAAIEHRAWAEMERWSYPLSESSTVSVPVTPRQEAWVAMRSDSESVAATKLPVTVEQWEAWQRTDRQKARRWSDRASRLAEDHQILELKAKEAEAVQVTLEDWRDQARDLAKVSAELTERNQRVEAELSETQSKLTDMRHSSANWKSRAETLQLEMMRLNTKLRAERVRRLEAKKARLEAVGKLKRVRGRRWWKLGSALGRWRRRPYRIDVLAADVWRLATEHAPLPPLPDTKAIQKEIKALKRPTASGKQPLDAARAAYTDGDYETALELIDALAVHVRNTPEALRLEKNCHIRMGEVSKALGAVRTSLLLAEDQALRSQQRVLEGRLRETHTGWLPLVRATVTSGQPVARSVLHILKESLPFFERGYTMRSHTTLLAQVMAGFEPTVVTSLGFPRGQGFDEFPKVEEIDGVVHHRLDLGASYDMRLIPYDQILDDQATLTAAIASDVMPAVIQAGSGYRGYETALVGLAVARAFEVPLIYEIRSFLEHTWTGEIERSEVGEYYERRYAQETRSLLDADFVVTIAEAMRSEIISRGIPEEKVAVVPNVVDVERFQPRPKNSELAAQYGISGRPVLGYISNLGAREGIENLIEAVALLRGSGLDVAGLVVGDGPMRSELEGLVGELGLHDHFVLTGHVPNEEIEDHYALIDLFVIPRVDDRAARLVTPLKPLEAMSMEIPVIASDLPALRELASPGDRGEVFEPGSPQALADVAKEVLNSADTRTRMVKSAKQWILTERTLESNAVRYTEILENVIRGN